MNSVVWDPYRHKIEYCSVCQSQHTWSFRISPKPAWVCSGCYNRNLQNKKGVMVNYGK